MSDNSAETPGRKPNPWRKLLLEMGPLIVFFAAFKFGGIFVATGAFMIAMPAAMAAAWHYEGHIPIMQKITFVIVMIMGGLTLYLENKTFVYMKPTIINGLFATILTVGLLRGRSYLKVVMGAGFPPMHDKGWMIMTRNWALFFVTLAGLNEFIWRNFSEDTWVDVKTFGFMPLFLIFAFSQAPLMMKYQIEEENNPDNSH